MFDKLIHSQSDRLLRIQFGNFGRLLHSLIGSLLGILFGTTLRILFGMLLRIRFGSLGILLRIHIDRLYSKSNRSYIHSTLGILGMRPDKLIGMSRIRIRMIGILSDHSGIERGKGYLTCTCGKRLFRRQGLGSL
jgi:hypothetical protein